MAKPLSVCILARKDLTRNTRIPRQAEVLTRSGYKVVVYALGKPDKHFIRKTRNCQYISVGGNLFHGLQKIRIFVLHLIINLVNYFSRKEPLEKEMVSSVSANASIYEIRRFVCPFNYFLENLFFVFLMRLRTGKKQFDYVQAHDSLSLWAAWSLARSKKAKLIYDAVEIPYLMTELPQKCFWKKMVSYGLLFERKILKKAHAIITVSSGISKMMASAYNINSPDIIRNCALYKKEGESTLRSDLGLTPDDKLVLYLNSISPGRGLEQLIESVKYLPHNIYVAAMGPEIPKGYKKKLNRQIRASGIDERFLFLEMVAPDEVSTYSSAADIGVIPSQDYCLNIKYSLPNRVFEMVMARLPIAATSLPEIRQFVESNEIGEIFNETDPKKIACTIVRMLKRKNYCKFKCELKRAAKKFCWQNESEKYVNVFKRGIYELS